MLSYYFPFNFRVLAGHPHNVEYQENNVNLGLHLSPFHFRLPCVSLVPNDQESPECKLKILKVNFSGVLANRASNNYQEKHFFF